MINNLSLNKKQETILEAVIIVSIVIGLIFFNYSVKSKQAQVKEEEFKLEELKSVLIKESQQQEDIENYQLRKKRLKEVLIKEQEIALLETGDINQLIIDLNLLAKKNNIEIVKFALPDDYDKEYRINLSIKASFTEIYTYLREIKRLGLSFLTEKLIIEAEQSKQDANKLTAEIELIFHLDN